jgi:ferredoxin
MRIVLDTTKCASLGICESLAPDYFEVQDDGTLLVKADVVSDVDLNEVREAVAACPTAALRLSMGTASAVMDSGP